MRLKHDWQVESWVLGGGKEMGGAVVWYPVKRVSLSDKSSRRPSQNDPLCVSRRQKRADEWIKENESIKDGAWLKLPAHYAWSNQTYTDMQSEVHEPILSQQHTDSGCWIIMSPSSIYSLLWVFFFFFVVTQQLWDVHGMECTATPRSPLPIWHQVDFNGFMENSGMPCWWRGFWVMEGFVKLLQCLEQGPYRHLPSLWRTQWDCTDPGGSNGY